MLYETEIEMETDMNVKSENGYENGLKMKSGGSKTETETDKR